ncbi:MAG: iron-sulfur cluster repair di-iron protein [Flavobacteriales bacterium]|nr:iron-sulfur cluster repair di-iron protein [Flavobacteriales bacterium]
MHLTPEQTIGSIVAEDHRAASVLTAHGIDFCCKGGRTVADVCQRKGIAPAALEREINDALARDTKAREDHRSWSLLKLADHIERVHHRYVEDSIPVLQRYLTKLCHVHGNRHPELFEVAEAFQGCASAMAMHMKKEELVLFPFIRQLERSADGGAPLKRPHFGTVENPVHLMMADHDAEGDRFRRIAELTHGYVNPPDGCATYATAMAMLRDFEADLHLHIHLENNILFPRAIALEKSLNP